MVEERAEGAEGAEEAEEEKMIERETFKSHKDLEVYKKAFEAAMQIFELSKRFPD